MTLQIRGYPPEPLEIKVKPIRGVLKIDWRRPNVLMPIGGRNSGKSATLEAIASQYAQRGPIIDLYCAWDSESLAYCRLVDANILLVHGDNVDVKCSWETRPYSKLTLSDFEVYDIIVSPPKFYYPRTDYYRCINRVCWELFPERQSWRNPWFLVAREVGSLLYARLQIVDKTQKAKAEVIEFLRQSRHMGVAVGIDSIDYTAVDKQMRVVVDYVWIKGTGIEGLPDHLRFVYKYVKPRLLDQLPPELSVVVSKKRPMGMVWTEYPPWHKEEKDDIIKELGIEIEYSEPPLQRGGEITDAMHRAIVEMREQDPPTTFMDIKIQLGFRNADKIREEWRKHVLQKCLCFQ